MTPADQLPDAAILKKIIRDELEALEARGLGKSGGGGYIGGMDPWQTSVENRLQDLSARLGRLRSDMNSDFRWTWGGMAATTLGLAGLLAKGFGWV